jgi:ParB family chromosome partitioning protein
MTKKADRFRLDPVSDDLDEPPQPAKRSRSPMAAAIAENGQSLDDLAAVRQKALEELKADALAYRKAAESRQIDELIDLDLIDATALKRDRTGLDDRLEDEEMIELKASIQARGLQNAIQVFESADGRYELETGWRRLMAFRALRDETHDPSFSRIRAKVVRGVHDLEAAYGRMVDENLIRSDVSFGEMALLAIHYASDPRARVASADEAVSILFSSCAPTKRSYIRRFVELIEMLGDALGDPRGIARNAGVSAARLISSDDGAAEALRSSLEGLGVDAGPAEVGRCVAEFVASHERAKTDPGSVRKAQAKPARKVEFRVGELKCTVRGKELRILNQSGFEGVPQSQLEKALEALRASLREVE